MKIDNIFKITKQRPLIKFKDYKYIGMHDNVQGVNYYVRKYDNFGNYCLMEAVIEKVKGFRKFVLGAGTKINMLDTFMMTYLQCRSDKKNFNIDEDFIKLAILNSKSLNEEFTSMYSLNLPIEIKVETNFMKALKDGYKLLYVFNNEVGNRKFAKVQVILVKELKQEFAGEQLGYVIFKTLEYLVKPSFIKGEKTSKYMYFEYPDIRIPSSILK